MRAAIQDRRASGTSLPELLVALALAGTLFAIAAIFSSRVIDDTRLQTEWNEKQAAVRIALALLRREIRSAGRWQPGGRSNGITIADRHHIAFVRDRNGDGDTRDSHERVAYAFDTERQTLTRRSGRSSPQPMLDDLSENGLVFVYRDAHGRTVAAGASGDRRSAIRRVDVTLALETDPSRNAGPLPRVERSTSIMLRNGGDR